jgi:streptogramin lyase
MRNPFSSEITKLPVDKPTATSPARFSRAATTRLSMPKHQGMSTLARAVITASAAVLLVASSGVIGRAQPATECQQLWVQRNQIFKAHGYCFKTQPAVEYFGNAGCVYNNQDSVPVTSAERSFIFRIAARERARGCHMDSAPPSAEPPSATPIPAGSPPPAAPGTSGDACKKFPGLC